MAPCAKLLATAVAAAVGVATAAAVSPSAGALADLRRRMAVSGGRPAATADASGGGPHHRALQAAGGNETVYIMTRDGVALRTLLFFPPVFSPTAPVTPAVYQRTPYNADGLAGSCQGYAASGYVCAAQDFRGRFLSNGSFDFWRSSGNDSADTMAWLVSQPWSNGRVGTTGVSADGIADYVQPLAAPAPPPPLAVQFNVVSMGVLHEMTFQGGGYLENLISGWLAANNISWYVPVVEAQEAWNTAYWAPIDYNWGPRWADYNVPAVHMAGFWDIFSTTQWNTVASIMSGGGSAARGSQWLVIDAGGHCGGGAITWPNATWGLGLAMAFADALFADVLGLNTSAGSAYALQHRAGDAVVDADTARRLMAAYTYVWYVMGPGDLLSTGNFWVGAATFPAANMTAVYLNADDKSLALTPPTSAYAPVAFAVDPSLPLPTVGGNNLLIQCGPQDQAPLEAQRPDEMVLFTSAPLDSAVGVRRDGSHSVAPA